MNYVRHLNDETRKYIGPSGDFIVLGKEGFVIPADWYLLPEWSERFKEDSARLDHAEYQEALLQCAIPLQTVQQDFQT